MTRLAEVTLHVEAPAYSIIRGFMMRLRGRFAHAQTAMQQQACLSAVPVEAVSDTRLASEDLTGIATFDPALPFFMQSGFGRHDR